MNRLKQYWQNRARQHHEVEVVVLLTVTLSAVMIVLFSRQQPGESAEWAARQERRAFPGAPPVIPHSPQAGRCVRCHSETGTSTPPLGIAPANPHLKTLGMSEQSNCRQCHVFRRSADIFADSEFEPLPAAVHGSRAFPHSPPTMPHAAFMRESCLACHGETARIRIRCSHPERVRCLQCHVREGDPNDPVWPEDDPRSERIGQKN